MIRIPAKSDKNRYLAPMWKAPVRGRGEHGNPVAVLAAQGKEVAPWVAVYIASQEGSERIYFFCNFD